MEITNYFEKIQNLYKDFGGTLKTGAKIDDIYRQFFFVFKEIADPIVGELRTNYPEWEVALWRATQTVEFVGTLNRLIQEHKTNLYLSIGLKLPEPRPSHNGKTNETKPIRKF